MEQEKVTNQFKDTVNIALLYLEQTINEMKKSADLKDKMTEKELNIYVMMLEARAAALLDITHRAFPSVFELFPDAHENLKNCYTVFKRFEKAGKLKECTTDYCKENPIDPKDLEGILTPEEVQKKQEAKIKEELEEIKSTTEHSDNLK